MCVCVSVCVCGWIKEDKKKGGVSTAWVANVAEQFRREEKEEEWEEGQEGDFPILSCQPAHGEILYPGTRPNPRS